MFVKTVEAYQKQDCMSTVQQAGDSAEKVKRPRLISKEGVF